MTGINSNNNVEIDGVPRHVLDLRPVVVEDPDPVQLAEHAEEDPGGRRYPRRDRCAPVWMGDYVTE